MKITPERYKAWEVGVKVFRKEIVENIDNSLDEIIKLLKKEKPKRKPEKNPKYNAKGTEPINIIMHPDNIVAEKDREIHIIGMLVKGVIDSISLNKQLSEARENLSNSKTL